MSYLNRDILIEMEAVAESNPRSPSPTRTAKMVVFDRVRRMEPASSQSAALSFAWALAASVSLLAVVSLATYLLCFPRL